MREEIAENIQRDLNGPADQEMAEAIQHLVLHHLNNIAIGRWVSVDERLPHVGFMGMVKHKTFGKGLMRMTHDRVGSFFNEKCSAGVSVKDEITHWLELDIPEVTQ